MYLAISISSSDLFGSGYQNTGLLGPIIGSVVSSERLIQRGVSKAFLGTSHLLSLKSDGSLWVNGNNEWSQFGNGTLTSTTTPLQIATGVAEAAAGEKHSFYLKTDGSLWAMGYNQYGELADGTTTERNTAIKLTQPAITQQPTARSVSVGTSVAFSATVTSTGAATYQWFKDGTAISGATATTYSLASTTAASAGNYSLVATNWLGSTTSTVAALTVISPVSITTQPTAQTVVAGNTATFSVVASGSAPLTYQWSKDGIAISGATVASYGIAATTTANAGSYTVLVTNSVGSVASTPATLTVSPAGVAPSITTQPLGQSLGLGTSATLSVVAAGTSPLAYQWSKNGTAIIGATSASLTFSSLTAGDAGSYSVVVSNALGSVTSNAASLAVISPPTITIQPANQTVVAGAPLTLSVSASGAGPLTYQWSKNGTAINGAISPTFNLSSSAAIDAGSYRVVVSTPGASVTSNTVTVTVNTPPTISSQPISGNIYSGSPLALTVSAGGTSPLNYQWFKDGTAISGAVSATYTLTGSTLNRAGSYYVVVTNVAGNVTSNTSTIFTPPLITTQPASSSVTAGASATFSVAASGSPTLGYQWIKNSLPIAGANGSSYTFTSATTSDAGVYAVYVSNSYGTANSSTVTLTVTPAPSAPVVTNQPASQTVVASFNASFSVSASGTAPLTYVWRKDDGTVVGGNSPTLAMNGTTSASAGSYTVTISNAVGSVTSNVATLTVNAPATTFTQRRSTGGSSNSLWSFAHGNGTMVAVGSPGLLYSSTDGVTWNLRASGTNEWLVGVAYGNNQFVAVGDNGRILRSTDGVVWTYAANEGTIFRLNGVIYAGDRWVAVGENGVIVTSTDANMWSPVLSGTTRFLHGLAYSEGYLIATGGSGTILSSADGLTWTTRNSGTINDLEACAVVGNYFLAVGDGGECVFSYVKSGGATWTNNSKYKPNTTARLRGLASGGGAAIAFTASGTAFYLPSIYGSWSQIPLPTSTTYLAAGFAQNRFYGFGTGEAIVQSEPFFAGRLGNLSTRGQTGRGGDVLISGLVVAGNSPKQMLIRAAGPALTNFGLSGVLSQPVLNLFDSTGTLIASNTGWNQSANDSEIRSASIAAGAFAFPESSADSALLIRLLPGSYTAQVSGLNGTTGTTLIETYDMESVQTMQSKLVNISSRGVVGSGQNIIIPGISVGGSSSRILLIRAVGPTLSAFGLTGTLANPTISVVQNINGTNTTLATNDDWETQNSTVTFTAPEVRELSTKAGAFALPAGSKDAALLFTTSTNTSYTVLVSGGNGETGVALVEVYDVTGL
jgi:hypothetical protein